MEHNFGHGHQYLATVLMLLMLLAFLLEPLQELCCPLFQAALAKAGPRYSTVGTIALAPDPHAVPRLARTVSVH